MWWAGLGSSCENQQAGNLAWAMTDTWLPHQLECTLPSGTGEDKGGLGFVFVVLVSYCCCYHVFVMFIFCRKTHWKSPFHTVMDSWEASLPGVSSWFNSWILPNANKVLSYPPATRKKLHWGCKPSTQYKECQNWDILQALEGRAYRKRIWFLFVLLVPPPRKYSVRTSQGLFLAQKFLLCAFQSQSLPWYLIAS